MSSFQAFVKQNTALATALLDGDRHQAEVLLRAAHDSMLAQHRANPKKANLAILETFYGQFATLDCETARVVQLVFGEHDFGPNADWLPFDKALGILCGPLVRVGFLERVIAFLHLLDWGQRITTYETMANTLHDVIERCRQHVKPLMTFQDTMTCLGVFRLSVASALESRCEYGNLLQRLLGLEPDIAVVARTVDHLRQLQTRPRTVRFARRGPGRVDKYGWLRDRWTVAQGILREDLHPGMLLQRAPSTSQREYARDA